MYLKQYAKAFPEARLYVPAPVADKWEKAGDEMRTKPGLFVFGKGQGDPFVESTGGEIRCADFGKAFANQVSGFGGAAVGELSVCAGYRLLARSQQDAHRGRLAVQPPADGAGTFVAGVGLTAADMIAAAVLEELGQVDFPLFQLCYEARHDDPQTLPVAPAFQGQGVRSSDLHLSDGSLICGYYSGMSENAKLVSSWDFGASYRLAHSLQPSPSQRNSLSIRSLN